MTTNLLTVGFRYKTLREIANAVKDEEKNSNGQFEFNDSDRSTILFHCCRCDVDSEFDNRKKCSAFVQVDRQIIGKQTWFVISDRNLRHTHVSSSNVDHTRDVLPNYVPSKYSADYYPKSIHQIKCEQLRSPNLVRFLTHKIENGYNCPYCDDFFSDSYVKAEQHVQMKHENDGVWHQNFFFVPCCCFYRKGHARKSASVHFHCFCGIILHSKIALINHLKIKTCKGIPSDDPRPSSSGHLGKISDLVANNKHNDIVAIPNTDNDETVKFFRNPLEISSPRSIRIGESGCRITIRPSGKCDSKKSSESLSNAVALHQDLFIRKLGEICKMCCETFDNLTALMEHECIDGNGNKKVRFEESLNSSETPWPSSRSAHLNMICPLCEDDLHAVEGLASHYRQHHFRQFSPQMIDQLKTSKIVFDSATAFFTWKSDLEVNSFAYYARKRRFNESNGSTTIFFACCFSWADLRTHLKRKKVERRCPAFIKATQNDTKSIVSVSYCTCHYGHDLDKMKFWKQVRKSLNGLASFRNKCTASIENRGCVENVTSLNQDETQEQTLSMNEKPGTSQPPSYGDEMIGADLNDAIPEVNLDRHTEFYWNQMRRHLSDSGVFPYSAEVKSVNGDSMADADDKFCRICKLEFKNRTSLVRHILKLHDPNRCNRIVSKYSRPVRCYFCNMEMSQPAMRSLIHHYINAHDQQIQLKMRVFENADVFDEWRRMVSGSMFKRLKCYKAAKGDTRRYWACKHGGKLVNADAAVTNGHCPGWIFAEFLSTGLVRVTYCLYHLGHKINDSKIVDPGNQVSSMDASDSENFVDSLNDETNASSNMIVYTPLMQNASILPDPNANSGSYLLEFSDNVGSSALQQSSTIYLSDVNIVGDQMNEISNETIQIESNDAVMMEITVETDNNDEQNQQISTAFDILKRNSFLDVSKANLVEGIPDRAVGQISVLVTSSTDCRKLVKVPLSDFRLVSDQEGKKYYAFEENHLINCVSQILTKNGDQLNEGDQLEILQ